MDSHGYKLTVALQYDDLFKEEFKEEATDKADAVMEVVTEMFSRMKVILMFYNFHNELPNHIFIYFLGFLSQLRANICSRKSPFAR